MIRTKSEYQFVTFVDDIQVTGNIMPKRTDRKLILGEDPAFLMESVEERRAVTSGSGLMKNMTREILASRLQDVAKDIRSLAYTGTGSYGRFVKSSDFAWKTCTYASKPEDDFGIAFSDTDLSSSQGDFAPGSPVMETPVSNLFADLQKLRRFYVQGPSGGSWSYSKTGTASDLQPDSSSGEIIRWTGHRTGTSTTTYSRYAASSGSYVVSPVYPSLVGGCRILMKLSVSAPGGTAHMWTPAVETVRSGGTFSVAASVLTTLAEQARSRSGLATNTYPTTTGRSSVTSIALSAAWAFYDLTDHTNQE